MTEEEKSALDIEPTGTMWGSARLTIAGPLPGFAGPDMFIVDRSIAWLNIQVRGHLDHFAPTSILPGDWPESRGLNMEASDVPTSGADPRDS